MTRRELVGSVLALGFGVTIALIDSSPGWDDTGMTAGALFLAAAVAAFVAGRRPWLIALLVGLPTPLFEIPRTGQPEALIALVFASIGALGGLLVVRWIQQASHAE